MAVHGERIIRVDLKPATFFTLYDGRSPGALFGNTPRRAAAMVWKVYFASSIREMSVAVHGERIIRVDLKPATFLSIFHGRVNVELVLGIC